MPDNELGCLGWLRAEEDKEWLRTAPLIALVTRHQELLYDRTPEADEKSALIERVIRGDV
jgi:hypothetical protein